MPGTPSAITSPDPAPGTRTTRPGPLYASPPPRCREFNHKKKRRDFFPPLHDNTPGRARHTPHPPAQRLLPSPRPHVVRTWFRLFFMGCRLSSPIRPSIQASSLRRVSPWIGRRGSLSSSCSVGFVYFTVAIISLNPGGFFFFRSLSGPGPSRQGRGMRSLGGREVLVRRCGSTNSVRTWSSKHWRSFVEGSPRGLGAGPRASCRPSTCRVDQQRCRSSFGDTL